MTELSGWEESQDMKCHAVGVGKKSNFLDPIHFCSNPIHL